VCIVVDSFLPVIASLKLRRVDSTAVTALDRSRGSRGISPWFVLASVERFQWSYIFDVVELQDPEIVLGACSSVSIVAVGIVAEGGAVVGRWGSRC